MDKETVKRNIKIYNWIRVIILVVFMTLAYVALGQNRSVEERLPLLEQKMNEWQQQSKYMPQVHGILRGKLEYQPEMDAARFEVRNARLSASGKLPLSSEYKLEVDLCDESSIKMKDAWVRVNPVSSLRLTLGQQRMPFSIDAHRNPSAQYFANRSFIAKQVGDMRDVGMQAGYDVSLEGRKVLLMDAGIFNGSNLDNQKSAWFQSPAYSARIQCFPIQGLALVPSVQHQQIANREASYTSLDMGTYYEGRGMHIEAEYLHKFYADGAFQDCNAVDAMVIFQQNLKRQKSFIQSISYLGRYDYMGDHSSGKSGFEQNTDGTTSTRLTLTDAERHRMTLGVTFGIRNPYFPTQLRLNYENYWYPHAGAKESERDKLVCELMIKF